MISIRQFVAAGLDGEIDGEEVGEESFQFFGVPQRGLGFEFADLPGSKFGTRSSFDRNQIADLAGNHGEDHDVFGLADYFVEQIERAFG